MFSSSLAGFQGPFLITVLVCAGRKPQRSHIKLFAFRQLGTLECTALTKICCKPLCIHADSLEMSLSERLSDEDLVDSVPLLVLYSLFSRFSWSSQLCREKSFILAPDLEVSKFKSMVLQSLTLCQETEHMLSVCI